MRYAFLTHLAYHGASMRMRDLARLTQVSKSTIEHYRIRGLLRARRTAAGDWDYPEDAPRAITLIHRRLTPMGFHLDAIKAILNTYSLEEIEERLRSLTAPQFRAWVDEVNGAAVYGHDL